MSFTTKVSLSCDTKNCKTAPVVADNRWDAWFNAKAAGWLTIKAAETYCPVCREARKPAKTEKVETVKPATKTTKVAKATKVAKPVTKVTAVGQSTGKVARSAKTKTTK